MLATPDTIAIMKARYGEDSARQFQPLEFREANERPLRYGAAARNREHPGKTTP